MKQGPCFEIDSSSARQEMEPEGSFPCSLDSTTGSYSEPAESNPRPHILFL
jgi:hypothetical protein